jgi:hypothetical protein
MSFTDQKQRIATAKDVSAKWGGGGFRCHLCGHHFHEGDRWRWVYAGAERLTNFLVCANCDVDDVIQRWKEANQELAQLRRNRFWWAFESDRGEA